jgi:hypothetical protein
MRIKRPSPSMIVALAALVLAAGGFAVAAIPEPNGTIHGCYKKDGGSLRVVKGVQCHDDERALSWNRGVAKVVVRPGKVTVHQTCSESTPGLFVCSGSKTTTVHCKGAERATGGGYDITTSGTANVTASKPFPEAEKPTGWTVSVSASTLGSSSTVPDSVVPIYVVCAN